MLKSSASHDPSEISLTCWFAAQETLLFGCFKKDSFIDYIGPKVCLLFVYSEMLDLKVFWMCAYYYLEILKNIYLK